MSSSGRRIVQLPSSSKRQPPSSSAAQHHPPLHRTGSSSSASGSRSSIPPPSNGTSRATSASIPTPKLDQREVKRQEYRARLDIALTEEDDPLAVYQECIAWTLENYGPDEGSPHDSNSISSGRTASKDPLEWQGGLGGLLVEVTELFRNDEAYKRDLRYLKMWVLYAAWVQQQQGRKPGSGRVEESVIEIYRNLEETGIGTSYDLLYQEYGIVLVAARRYQDADALYARGVQRGARPVQRLKSRYNDFKKQYGHLVSGSKGDGASSSSRPQSSDKSSKSSSSSSRPANTSPIVTTVFNSTAASRYATMLAPPAPDKRPEKFRFQLSLLFTDEGMEYSIQEARARSMGLLSKKWGPPPASEMRSPLSASPALASASVSQMPVDFNDSGQKASTKNMAFIRRSSILGGGAEPTMTINTKEALNEVLGMYNSPDRTGVLPGSKHAPLKRVEPITPATAPRPTFTRGENENAFGAKTPTPAFRPFTDENSQAKRPPPTKMTPSVDSAIGRTLAVTPAVTPRAVLGAKETTTPAPPSIVHSENPPPRAPFTPKPTAVDIPASSSLGSETVFKVFTPVDVKPDPFRDVFTDDHGKPQTKFKTTFNHERAKSHQDLPSLGANLGASPPSGNSENASRPQPMFKPFTVENSGGAKTPFKVFSRPGEDEEPMNAITPKPAAAFRPFSDKPTFTPYREGPPSAPSSRNASPAIPQTAQPTFAQQPTFIPPSGPTFQIHADEDDSVHSVQSVHSTRSSNRSLTGRVLVPQPRPASPVDEPRTERTSHTPPWENTENTNIINIPDDEEEPQTEFLAVEEEEEQDPDQYTNDYIYDSEELIDAEQYGEGEEHLQEGELTEYAEEEEEDDEMYGYQHQRQREVPLGGRFGAFTVMTPITERTYEFTTETKAAFGLTPSARARLGHIDEDDASLEGMMLGLGRVDENGAIRKADRLASELRGVEEEDEEEEELFNPRKRPMSPFRLSDDPVSSPAQLKAKMVAEREVSRPGAEKSAVVDELQPPDPCNPFDPEIITEMLSFCERDPNFHDLKGQEINALENLAKFSKKAKRNSGDVISSYPLSLNGQKFTVYEKLGEGGFGMVFKARDLGMSGGKNGGFESDDDFDDLSDLDDLDDDLTSSPSLVALKVVKPRSIWEYHVLHRLHASLPENICRSLVLPHALYAFADESYLVLELCPQGMLLNIVNTASTTGISQQGACLDELLVIFFSIELLRLVEAIHCAGFIHGDLKIDNCLIRLEEVHGGPAAWSSNYSPEGEGGWNCKGLKLIDFGRTIDTNFFPSSQQFIADWPTDDRDCFEIRNGQPWTYQTDYFGLAGIIYCMLFGKYITASAVVPAAAEQGGGERYRINTPLKRYWQKEIWTRVFDLLLNPCSVNGADGLPIVDELAEVRREMEEWLKANCNRTSGTLKGLLKKVEMACLTQ